MTVGPSGGGMAEVAARVASIQARIDTVTGVAAAHGTAAFTVGSAAQVLAAGSAEARASVGVAPTTSDPESRLAEVLPEAGRPWAALIDSVAEEVGIDPALLAALVRHESNFGPDARSPAGAIGLTQLMPGTAAGLDVDPTDPQQNLEGGARYLRQQLDRFGDVALALAAYNAGPGRVVAAGGVPRIPETMTFVDRVMETWEALR